MIDIEEVLAKARRPENIVPLCLRGDLIAEFTLLERRLAAAPGTASNMEEPSEALALAQQIEELRRQMRAAEVPFLLRAMPPLEWTAFYATQPARAKDEPDETWAARWYGWVCQLVAHTCIDPVMSVEQVDQLVQRLSGPQWDELADTAWQLNSGKVSIPFSAAASRVMAATAPTSRPPEPPASASPASSARSRGKSPRTSTTRKAASPARSPR